MDLVHLGAQIELKGKKKVQIIIGALIWDDSEVYEEACD